MRNKASPPRGGLRRHAMQFVRGAMRVVVGLAACIGLSGTAHAQYVVEAGKSIMVMVPAPGEIGVDWDGPRDDAWVSGKRPSLGDRIYWGVASPQTETRLQYTARADAIGTDTLTFGYRCSPYGSPYPCGRASVTFTVVAPKPVISGGSLDVDFQGEGQFTLGGGYAEYRMHTQPVHGRASIAGNVVTYRAAPNFSGSDTLSVVAVDRGSVSDPVTIEVRVAPPPRPVIQGGNLRVRFNDRANHAAKPNFAMELAVITPPLHGTVLISANSIAQYRPHTDYIGPDSFQLQGTNAGGTSDPVTVYVTVEPPPRPSVVGGELAVSFNEPGAFSFTPTNGGELSVAVAPSHGTVEIDGLIARYTPARDFVGDDSFGVIATNKGGASDLAEVRVTVAPPPAPTLTGGSISVPYEGQGTHHFAPTFGGVLKLVTSPAHGQVRLEGGEAHYSADPGYFGPDAFGVIATNPGGNSSEAVVAVTVVQPSAPAASNATITTPYETEGSVTLSSSGVVSFLRIVDPPNHGAASIVGQTAIYMPQAGFFGDDAFTFEAVGPGGPSGAATVSVRVGNPAAPFVHPLTLSVAHGGTITATVKVDGVYSALQLASIPAGGAVTIAGDTLTYAARPGFAGVERLALIAKGPGGDSLPAEVAISVEAAPAEPEPPPPPSEPPVTEPEVQPPPAVGQEGQAGTTMRFRLGAVAAAASAIGVEIAEAPPVGTASVEEMDILYNPPADFAGDVELAYRLVTPKGPTPAATVRATVHPIPDEAVQEAVAVTSANGSGEVDLTEGAANGPFSAARITSISPAHAGEAEIVRAASAPRHQRDEGASAPAEAGDSIRLRFIPAAGFYGEVVIRYALTNRFDAPTQGVARFKVDNRADPTRDAKVVAIVNAQVQAAGRFGAAQISNASRRMEARRDGATSPGGIALTSSRSQPVDPFVDPIRERTMKEMSDKLASGKGTVSAPEQEEVSAAGSPGTISVWTGGTMELGERKASGAGGGFDFATSGISLGADMKVTEAIIAGVGVGGGRDKSDLGDGAKMEATAASVFAYASYSGEGAFFVDGLIGYGTLDFDTRRIIDGAILVGSRSGDQLFAAISAGWEMSSGPAHFAPYGRIELTRSRLKSYVEQGDEAYVLAFDDLTVDQQSGILGLRGRYAFKTPLGLVEPTIRAEYVWSLRSAGIASIGYAIGSEQRYHLPVALTDDRRGLIGGGVRWTTDTRWIFNLDVERLLSESGDSTAIRLGGAGTF